MCILKYYYSYLSIFNYMSILKYYYSYNYLLLYIFNYMSILKYYYSYNYLLYIFIHLVIYYIIMLLFGVVSYKVRPPRLVSCACLYTTSVGLSECAKIFPVVKGLVKFFSEIGFRLPKADIFQLSSFCQKFFPLLSGS